MQNILTITVPLEIQAKNHMVMVEVCVAEVHSKELYDKLKNISDVYKTNKDKRDQMINNRTNNNEGNAANAALVETRKNTKEIIVPVIRHIIGTELEH